MCVEKNFLQKLYNEGSQIGREHNTILTAFSFSALFSYTNKIGNEESDEHTHKKNGIVEKLRKRETLSLSMDYALFSFE